MSGSSGMTMPMPMPSNGSMHGGMMKMYFHFSAEECHIVFWGTSTALEMFLTCLFYIALTVAFEALKIGRILLDYNRKCTCPSPTEYTKDMQPIPDCSCEDQSAKKCGCAQKVMVSPFNKCHSIQTVLLVVQVTVAYILMLAVMTFNGWICLSVLLGHGLGYFAVGWKHAKIPGREQQTDADACH